MDQEAALLRALHADPADEVAWMVLGDWLEEHDQPDRAELVRLWQGLRSAPGQNEREARLADLLAERVVPCMPTLTNSLAMTFSLVPPGTFCIGSTGEESGREADEEPAHEVEITRPYYLGIYPVTQEQFEKVLGVNPSHFSRTGNGKTKVRGLDTLSFPVEMVTWEETVNFCQALSERPEEKRAGRSYRLPTEAEWEYACRAAGANTTTFQFGHGLSSHQANFDGNHPYGGGERGPYLERPTPVGSYPPNALGLYDMHGNIYEWCADWFDRDFYRRGPSCDPHGPDTGTGRVVRGGSWFSPGSSCRSAYRGSNAPGDRSFIIGFRVVCVLAQR